MVKNILKDGTVLEDLTGHVVKQEEAPLAYQLIDSMNDDLQNKTKSA